jgi:hypothetical protein
MRKYLALAAVLGVTACGGGGGGTAVPSGSGGNPTPSPSPTPGSGTQAKVTPTFRITIPKVIASTKSSSSTKRQTKGVNPQYISPSVESISITLTEVNGTPPGALTGNPATSNISSATCSSGCTVSGPPSPLGSDTFVLTTYDAPGGGGNALETNTGTYTLTQGINNAETITLLGMPASFSIANVPAPGVDATLSSTIGGPANAGIQVSVFDADGNTLTGTYANAVTVSDPDTNGDGSSVRTSACPGTYPVGNPGASSTSVTLTSDTSAAHFCYGGLAENPQTLSASASGATSGTGAFQPVLAVPVELAGSATPADVAVDSDGNGRGDIALFATSGTGSTGSITYTEAGWTDSPYEQALDGFANLACGGGGESFSNYATGPGGTVNGSSGTVFTVTAIGSPSAASCPLTITDALLSNSTDSNGLGDGVPLVELDTSYTSSSFNVNAHKRK